MIRRFALLCSLLLAACDSPPSSVTTAGSPAASTTAATPAPAAASVAPRSANQLRLTLDGTVWQADRDFFGAWHPPGMDRAVLMAGSLGPKDKHEQAFNLNLFGVTGPGRYVASGNTMHAAGPISNAFQLANLSEQRYLIGGPFGYEVTIDLLQAGNGIIEARFSGQATASDGKQVALSDGYFFFRE